MIIPKAAPLAKQAEPSSQYLDEAAVVVVLANAASFHCMYLLKSHSGS
jgi:hypothetical protein